MPKAVLRYIAQMKMIIYLGLLFFSFWQRGGVKKLALWSTASFRRKPESRIYKGIWIFWTPVPAPDPIRGSPE